MAIRKYLKMKYTLIASKILLYFILLVFISAYFKLSEFDENCYVLFSRMPISIIAAILAVFAESKLSNKK